jgi:hypothetical protein
MQRREFMTLAGGARFAPEAAIPALAQHNLPHRHAITNKNMALKSLLGTTQIACVVTLGQVTQFVSKYPDVQLVLKQGPGHFVADTVHSGFIATDVIGKFSLGLFLAGNRSQRGACRSGCTRVDKQRSDPEPAIFIARRHALMHFARFSVVDNVPFEMRQPVGRQHAPL